MGLEEYVIFYGTERWSAYFTMTDDAFNEVKDLKEHCQNRVEREVMSNPEIFEEVRWVKVYGMIFEESYE